MFMNRVHEQRQKNNSGTIPSQNGSKIGRVNQVHSPRPARAPSAQAVRLPRPAARAPAAQLPARPAVPLPAAPVPTASPALCAPLHAQRLPVRSPRARPRTPQRPRLRPARLPTAYTPSPAPMRPTQLLRVVSPLQ